MLQWGSSVGWPQHQHPAPSAPSTHPEHGQKQGMEGPLLLLGSCGSRPELLTLHQPAAATLRAPWGTPVNLLQSLCFTSFRSLRAVPGGVSWNIYHPLQREFVCASFFNKVLVLSFRSLFFFYSDIIDTGLFKFFSMPCSLPSPALAQFSLPGTLGYLHAPRPLPWFWLPGSSSLAKSSLLRRPLDFPRELGLCSGPLL